MFSKGDTNRCRSTNSQETGAYAKGGGPDWLAMERVLRAFELAEDGRGRRAYVAWLEARASEDGGKINDEAQAALRRGWYLGEESFKNKLLAMVDRVRGGRNPRNAMGSAMKDHGEAEAERLVREVEKALELPTGRRSLERLRKGDEKKVLLAALLRRRTSVGLKWISEKLAMGHSGSVNRLEGGTSSNRELAKRQEDLEEMLKCENSYDPASLTPPH